MVTVNGGVTEFTRTRHRAQLVFIRSVSWKLHSSRPFHLVVISCADLGFKIDFQHARIPSHTNQAESITTDGRLRVCARAFGTVFNAALIVQVRMKEGSAYIQQLNVHSEQDNIRDPFLRERTVEGRCQILQQYLGELNNVKLNSGVSEILGRRPNETRLNDNKLVTLMPRPPLIHPST